MNIFLREMRSNLKALIIWIVSVGAFASIMMYEFSAFYNNPDMHEFMDALPESVLRAFQMAGSDITTLTGFVSMASIYFLIALAVYSAILGSSLISKEERDKTSEFLMTLPVSRNKAVTSKLFSGIILSLMLNLSLFAFIYITSAPFERGENFYRFSLYNMTGFFLVQLFFLGLGMAIASVMRNHRQSGKVTLAVLFLMYTLSVMISLSDKLERLHYFSPFKYFEAGPLAAGGSPGLRYILICLGVFIVGIAVTYSAYNKRDLNI